MTVEVKVPSLPESVSDGTLVNWKKQPGDVVKRGDNLVDLETDKVVLDIPAPADGILGQILRQEGDIVTTGDVIATLEESAGAQAAAPTAVPAPVASAPVPVAAPAVSATEVDLEGLSPAVRRLAVAGWRAGRPAAVERAAAALDGSGLEVDRALAADWRARLAAPATTLQ